MVSEKNGTKIVTEDLSTLGGDMMARLRPDVEFRVEDDKNGKVMFALKVCQYLNLGLPYKAKYRGKESMANFR